MKYYIATKLENYQAHNDLRDQLHELGYECTYDWTLHGLNGPVYKQGLERCEEVAQLEHEGVANCDVLIMLWPGGRGTHVELGMGIALGKICFIVSDVEGHHLPSPETCAFYHHPHCNLVTSLSELMDRLSPLESSI